MSELRETIEAAMAGTLEGGSDEASTEAPAPDAGAGSDAPASSGAAAAGDGATDTPAHEEAAAKPGAASRARDEKGRFAATAESPPAAVTATKGGKEEKTPGGATPPPAKGAEGVTPPPAQGASDEAKAPAPGATESTRAPQSWKPAAREAWKDVPPAVQAEVHRREREVAQTLQESVHARRFAESFNQAVGPYMGTIQAEGGNPVQTIASLLQTAQALRGPGKAAVVANIIRNFDVDIGQLDALLAGQPAPQGQTPQGEYRDPRVDQLFSTLEHAQAQRQRAVQERAQRDIETFKERAEFLEDVKPHMSALLADAAHRRQAMTLDEAYDMACWANKEIRAILQGREAAKAANAAQASTQRARVAASSIRSQPAAASTGAQSPGLRGDIEAAMAKLSGR